MNWIDKWQILNCELLILFGLRLLTFLRLLFCSGLLVDVRLLFYLCFIDLLLGDILFLLVCIRILSLFLLLLRLLLLFLSFLLLFCLFPSFLGENFLKMLIFVKTTVVEVPDVKKLVVLLISLDQSSIFTFFQRQILVLHIDALLIFDYHFLAIWIMPFILKSAKLLYVNLSILFFVNMHTMQFQLISRFECNKLLIEAVAFTANIMGHFIMGLQTLVVFIISVLLLSSAYITYHMLQIDVNFKLIVIEEILLTETTVRVQENNVTKLVNISSVQMLCQLTGSVKFLLVQNTSLFLETNIAKIKKKVTTYADYGLIWNAFLGKRLKGIFCHFCKVFHWF